MSNRHVWADTGGVPPDGICIDNEGAVWYADVPHQCSVRITEGGEVQQTVTLDQACFACMLGGEDGAELFMMVADWDGIAGVSNEALIGRVLSV